MFEPQPVPEGAKQGDYGLFEALYPRLRRFAAVVADADIDPDDLVQDALLATLRRHDLAELEHPEAYLRRAVLNRASNRRRGLARFRGALRRLSPESEASDQYPSDLSFLDALSEVDRGIVYMADVEGVPLGVIARDLDLTPAAVRKRVSRARNQLRKELSSTVVAISEVST